MADEPGPPASARRRLEEIRRGAWTSDLSVAEFAALQSVGLDPVGQVLGTTVFLFGWSGRRSCGSRFVSSGVRRLGPPKDMPGLVDALYQARRSALQRMQDEAVTLGADGVVGTRLSLKPFSDAHLSGTGMAATQRILELTVIGTAVRARSTARPQKPFVCDLSGQDTAALLLSGWVPTGMVLGVGAVVSHDGSATWNRTRMSAPTAQVPRWTNLANQSRADARRRLEEDVRRHGGQTAVIASTRVDVHEQQCSNAQGSRGRTGGVDHLVETVLVGTAIRRFHRDEATPRRGRTLPVVLLGPRGPGAPESRTASLADPLARRRGREAR